MVKKKQTAEQYRSWARRNPEKVSAKRARRYARIRSARDADCQRAVDLIANLGAVPVAEHQDYYVTPDGIVYSTMLRRLIPLRPGIKPGGYEFVGLRSEGALRCEYRMVHRIVSEAFIPNPLGLPEVNHKDGNKRNNRVANLEWTTRPGNIKHAYENGLMHKGSKNPCCKLTAEQAREIRTATGRYRDIGASYGVSAQTICNVKRRSKYADVE